MSKPEIDSPPPPEVPEEPEILINAATSKAECRQVLRNAGVLDLFAGILRDLYEDDEIDWPANATEYLLGRILDEIPIVKQMNLMKKNFQKRIVELDKEFGDTVARMTVYYKMERKKTLLMELAREREGSGSDSDDDLSPAHQ